MSENNYYDSEEEEIKRKKLEEYKKLLEEARRREEERRKFEIEKQQILMTILTPKARERLNNIRLVKPELAENIELQLIQLVQMKRLQPPITENIIKRILLEIDKRSRREIKIKFLRREI